MGSVGRVGAELALHLWIHPGELDGDQDKYQEFVSVSKF
jgi:hypothetical protein